MKKILIATWVLLSQACLADSKWGLSQETENRLSAALELVNANKPTQQNRAGVNFVTVGNDATCDFRVGVNRIQNAIDSGAQEIRIASNMLYEETLQITNPAINLTLRGGFSDCIQAENNNQSDLSSDWAEITRDAGSFDAVFYISGLPQGRTTVFENLKLIGGDGQDLGTGGSLRLFLTSSDVVLNRVWLTEGNDIFRGGGLVVQSSNSQVILNKTDIFNNTAKFGGGIYCNNSAGTFATIILAETSNLFSNTASSNGGGALIGTGCLLATFSGSSIVNGEKGIFNNTAVDHGGAINVSGGGDVLVYGHIICGLAGNCFGNSTDPASIYGNQANTNGVNRNGGAITATGTGTDVSIVAGHIYANTINPTLTPFGAGGAISLTLDASLNISHPGPNNTAVACWNIDKCNLFNDNSGSGGGVIYTNDSLVNISHAVFEDNRAHSGTAIYVSGTEDLNIENTIFSNNGNNGTGSYRDEYLIQAMGPDVNISYTTIADNKTQLGVFMIQAASSTLNLQSSIIHDIASGNVVNANSGTIISHCVMSHELTSFSGLNNVLDDPEFVDRANRDYHLDAGISPAIDYCEIYPTLLNKDIDYQERGFDNLSLSNFLGTYDLGADESYAKTYLTVGGDASCDFNTSTQSIQDAIDTGIGEVRVATNGLHNKSVSIVNKNVKLRGGYVDCSAANNDIQTTRTDLIVTVGTIQSVINISGSSQRNTIELENFNLTGLGLSAVSVYNAYAEILLKNVVMQNTVVVPNGIFPAGVSGGGVFIAQSNVKFDMVDTIIMQNFAPKAGGLYCRGSGIEITMSGNSGLAQNTTTGKGGGAYITEGCTFTMYSGIANPSALTTVGISANIADEEGGGIYADLGGQIILNGHQDCSQACIGDNINPVSVNHNKSNAGISSGERGGGIYITGSGTTAKAYAVLFSENLSPNGGAVYVNDFASLTVARLSKDCWDPVKCNYFFKNRALGAGTGGAIQNDQGFIKISSAYFEENDGRTGSVLYAFGSNSHNNFESCVFNHNNNQGTGDKYVIRAAVSSSVEITHSTFADNYITNTSVFGITSDSELRLFSSIINEPDGDVLAANPGNVVSDCLMIHEAFSLSGTNSTNIFLDDPEFVDRNNRDYHLNMNTSPAIDVCDDSVANIQFNDIDFDVRGIDDNNVININGPFDIGADEAVINDVIFKNGFE